MARTFLQWAVGPLSPGRVGAVLGFVAGVVLAHLGAWLAYGEVPNLFPMLGIPLGGGAGALIGFAIGRVAGRRVPPG
jgi:hypothetical protein